ncbi:MAG: hypothetical protein HYU58_05525 [Proteobacteria bacterium]|nr:hypothetical protein [Pseudomonadota bacterium]
MTHNNKPAEKRPERESAGDDLALPPFLTALLRQAIADPMPEVLADWPDMDAKGRKP